MLLKVLIYVIVIFQLVLQSVSIIYDFGWIIETVINCTCKILIVHVVKDSPKRKKKQCYGSPKCTVFVESALEKPKSLSVILSVTE